MSNNSSSPTSAPMDEFLGLEEEATGQPSTTETATPETPTIPDKYRGKSVDDLINMHQNAERRLSQQGAELGEVRRLADQLIGIKTAPNANAPTRQIEQRKPVTVEALLENPEQVLNDTLQHSPAAQKADEASRRLDQLELTVQQRDFMRQFPNYQADMQNPDFIDWVKKNPLRQQLATAAYQNDYSAANGLWSLWGEHQELAGNPKPTGTSSKAQKVKDATTQRGGAQGESATRFYSRAKLMELRAKVADGDAAAIARWNDADFQAKLVEAYDKGLVR